MAHHKVFRDPQSIRQIGEPVYNNGFWKVSMVMHKRVSPYIHVITHTYGLMRISLYRFVVLTFQKWWYKNPS